MGEAEATEDLLDGETLGAVEALGPAEILIGIFALNQSRSVVRVVEAAAAGLAKHLATRAGAVLVADGGSGDGTVEAVQAWGESTPPAPPVRCLRLEGPPSRGRAVLALLEAARRLRAPACALVDAGLIGLAPDAIERLLRPVVSGEADYVSPAYSHGVSEGTLTSNLLAPLARALYGKRIQQVVGGCAALSCDLVRRLLEAEEPEDDLARDGVEVWLAAASLASGARVAEASLGRKILDAGLAPPDLATTLARTVGPFFRLMERYNAVWSEIRGSVPVPQTAGGAPVPLVEAGGAQTDRMVHAFRLGLKDLLPIWEQVMPEDTLGQLYPLGLLAPDEFRFPPGVWARVISDFAVAHHEGWLARDHLLRAMTPLYLGRVAAFLLEVQAGPAARVPAALETIGRAFETEKASLVARWR